MIHLRQVGDDGIEFDGASLELHIDDDDQLKALISSLVVSRPDLTPLGITEQHAIDIVLDEFAPGYVLTVDDTADARTIYSRTGFAQIEVTLVLPAPLREWRVIVDGQTGEILAKTPEFDGHTVSGFHSESSEAFLDHPPFHNLPGMTPAAWTGNVDAVELGHLLNNQVTYGQNGLVIVTKKLEGHYARVLNAQQSNWTPTASGFPGPGGELPVPPPFYLPDRDWMLRLDRDLDDINMAEDVSADNSHWESRFDEVSAYYNIDIAGEYFRASFAHEMNRSPNARPSLQTVVNDANDDNNSAWFLKRRYCYYDPYPFKYCDRFRPIIKLGGGDRVRLLSEGDNVTVTDPTATFIADAFSKPDLARARDLVWHEYTHAMTWDVVDQRGSGYGHPFREAIADFFPASAFGRSLWNDNYALHGRELDPIDPLTGEEIDLAIPYDVTTPVDDQDNWYSTGEIWSGFLWDLRKRAVMMQDQFNLTNLTEHTVEAIQFEALFYMDRDLASFEEAFRSLLVADQALNGKQLSYDLIAMGARHGIKERRAIAGIAPDRFVVSRDGGDFTIAFDVYSGSNDEGFALELTTAPELLDEPPVGNDSRYLVITCEEPTCAMDQIPASAGPGGDRENLTKRVIISGQELEDLASDSTIATTVFYRVTTYGELGKRRSDIPNAGVTWQHSTYPAFVILAAGQTEPGCAANVVGGRASSWSSAAAGALLFLAVVFRARRRNGR